jgi:hypothetical protein
MLELGVRYRAGRDPVAITHRDGRVVQLDPFQPIRFREPPLKIDGRLYRTVRGRVRLETKVP